MTNFARFKLGIQVGQLASDPVNGEVGEMYYNATSNIVRICTQAMPLTWETIVIGGAVIPNGIVDNSTLRWNAGTNEWLENPNILTLGNILKSPDNASGTALYINAGSANAGNNNGGDLFLNAGLPNGAGTSGKIELLGRSVNIKAQSATDPVFVASAGEIYYNTTDNKYKFFDGSSWTKISSGGGLIKVGYCDPVSTTLPTGANPIIDNITIAENSLVLFTALSSGNNRIYKATNVAVSVVWTAQILFDTGMNPSSGDEVIITDGDSFKAQVGTFDGSSWTFSEKRRQFVAADYFEESAIYSVALADNTPNTVFTVGYVGSEYQIVKYSIKRGSARETGQLYIVTDGTNVTVTSGFGALSSTGTIFSGAIVGPNLVLTCTTDNSGSSGVIKFSLVRWSDSIGGPGGPPSYTGFSSSNITGSGANNQLVFWTGANTVSGNTNFTIDTSLGLLKLGALSISGVTAPITLLDNTAVSTTIFSYPKTKRHATMLFGIERNGEYRTGELFLANNGTIVVDNGEFVETALLGVYITAIISGSNVDLQYTTDATGFDANFTYSIQYW